MAETLVEQCRDRGIDDVYVAAQNDDWSRGQRTDGCGVEFEAYTKQSFGANNARRTVGNLRR
jgi:hypothetical protein